MSSSLGADPDRRIILRHHMGEARTMTLLRADLDAAQLSWPRALARLLVLDPFWLVAAYR